MKTPYAPPAAKLISPGEIPGLIKGLGWCEIVVGVLLMILLTDIFITSTFVNETADLNTAWVVGVGSILTTFFVIVGWKLKEGSYWARTTILVFSFIRLVAFPLGTIWGGIAIYAFLANRDVKDFYASR